MPRTKIERFLVPVVDVHSHAYAETPEQIAAWVALMDRIGVRDVSHPDRRDGREIPGDSRPATPAPIRAASRWAPGMEKEGVEAADYGERLRRAVRADVAAGARRPWES